MSYRYGGKSRPGSQVQAWLGGSAGEPWFQQIVSKPINSNLATITADSVAHVKGAWTEIIASTSSDADSIYLQLRLFSTSAVNTAGLLDVGIGGSGSEVVVIENLPTGGAEGVYHLLPLRIPAGSRIAARFQCAEVSNTGEVTIKVLNTGNYVSAPTSLVTLGANTATSAGVNITAATYTQIVSSTSQDFSFVHLAMGLNSTATQIRRMVYTLGVGAASSEVAIQEVQYNVTSTLETIVNAGVAVVPSGVFVPAGSRLSAKVVELNSLTGITLCGVILGART